MRRLFLFPRHTGLGERAGPRLRELLPRGQSDRGRHSLNLGHTFVQLCTLVGKERRKEDRGCSVQFPLNWSSLGRQRQKQANALPPSSIGPFIYPSFLPSLRVVFVNISRQICHSDAEPSVRRLTLIASSLCGELFGNFQIGPLIDWITDSILK